MGLENHRRIWRPIVWIVVDINRRQNPLMMMIYISESMDIPSLYFVCQAAVWRTKIGFLRIADEIWHSNGTHYIWKTMMRARNVKILPTVCVMMVMKGAIRGVSYVSHALHNTSRFKSNIIGFDATTNRRSRILYEHCLPKIIVQLFLRADETRLRS